jgi:hypothetical protein
VCAMPSEVKIKGVSKLKIAGFSGSPNTHHGVLIWRIGFP